jgi:DNA-binding MarR family transcriptional regulator
LGLKRANLVALLDELEDRELLVRMPSPSDRRSYQLHLTENGQSKMIEISACHDRYENELTAKLGESGRQTLLDLLSALHHPADGGVDLDLE